MFVFVTRRVFGLRVFFPRTVGRAAGKSVQSSFFFVSRVFHVATPHCKPCVAYAGMCM